VIDWKELQSALREVASGRGYPRISALILVAIMLDRCLIPDWYSEA
jgi:hypothetical protein